MGYSIIFETKIVKLDDGRIIHFNRSGCNNDDAGRRKDEFTAKIYANEEDFIKYASKFMKESEPYKVSGEFDLKIGNRFCSMYDYGEHLIRMCRRALTVGKFLEDYRFTCREWKGIEVIELEEKELNCDEAEQFFREVRGSYRYRVINDYTYTLNDKVIDLITNQKDICRTQFEIIKRRKIV